MTVAQPATEILAEEGRYLTFTLSGESYGMPIQLVEEVISQMPITDVPNTPSFILGVINLRGRVMPVIDLRLKLRMKRHQLDRFACVVILKIPIQDGIMNIGMVAEHVEDIRYITQGQISAPPNFGVKVNINYLDGVVKTEGEPALLLINAVRALTAKELRSVLDVTEQAEE